MSAERAIHEHWSGYRPLVNLVPPERTYTGLPPIRNAEQSPIQLPYVSLTVESESQIERSSSGTTFSSEQIRFSIFSASYEEARRIEAIVFRYFNRRGFSWSDGQVLDMRPGNRTERESEDDGVWMIARDFEVRLMQTSARILA